MPADARFVVWCAACGWNTDPEGPKPLKGRLQIRAKRSADRRGDRLHADLAAHAGAGVAAPSLDAAGIAAHVLAWLVHLTTVVVAVTGVLLVVLGFPVLTQVLPGLVLLLLAAAIRPRFPRLPRHAVTLERADAPRLFALLDSVASAAGTRTADKVVIDAGFNASVTAYGIRHRRLLTLGLPLWHVLTPQQRVAVLGHEFGHYANGDMRRGMVVGTALNTLAGWYVLLLPAARLRRGALEAVARALMTVPRGAVLALLRLLDRCTLHTARRAEYRADAVAARTASTEAMVEVLDALLGGDSVMHELRRQGILARTRNRGADPRAIADGLWAHLAEHARTVPGHEWERLRRVDERRGHRVRATHPPRYLRRDLLAKAPPEPGTVWLDAAEVAAIDAELAVLEPTLAKDTLRDLHL
ncbi:M48 family metallopeptidase [Actinacidiphila acidipaludis]|uniref:M48 family metallopeptidase n=1 Tax=Actinacidiphila acidipaludis TaxID=2873382 RepID=UPI0027DFFB07|nr:M48 family metallopeptidase [Streptomyces acidipaludis]